MKNIDYSKPLSKKDVAYLKERLPLEQVEYYINQAGGSEEETPVSDPEGGSDEGSGGDELFDPSKANVAEVQEYLLTADDDETARVLAAETAGQGRKGILEA